eukprot:CAMPEP_0114601574 /NCGR_PEP_ID=MMETSP0125-20121206/24207_1 /TAXON_ID=485358 ORGANISM="Aristerostoma sp., Strain ATCC 50986" /NCGR_SAMPLE_ID=MMETSP0125 /ASSEMBLY_ACC=CAM_ASM_000245 /LENGTH=202 /DNA_ID=CAMNT_0001810967 /DNA_START=247 /DNA_END=855 /DNA_ORIENTATION=+
MNYYSAFSQDVQPQYSGKGVKALSPVGKELYQKGKNAQFRITCGDTIIASYNQGAAVVVSLVFTATNPELLYQFKRMISFKHSPIGIMDLLERSNPKELPPVTLNIKVSQFGAQDFAIDTLISESSVQCGLDQISLCKQTIEKVNSYIKDEFPSQFNSTEDFILFLGKFTLGDSINDAFKLKLHPSFVTPNVTAARQSINQF